MRNEIHCSTCVLFAGGETCNCCKPDDLGSPDCGIEHGAELLPLPDRFSAETVGAKQARELAQSIGGFDARDLDSFERQVRAGATVVQEHNARAANGYHLRDGAVLWNANELAAAVERIKALPDPPPSVFDELELALRAGASLDVGATPIGFHAVLEGDKGFAQATGAELLGVLLELVRNWKAAAP